MASDRSESERDEEWLYDQDERLGRRPSESQVENFCERVAVMVCDGKMIESDARRAAFKVVMGG